LIERRTVIQSVACSFFQPNGPSKGSPATW
jgi:hypothetical protein